MILPKRLLKLRKQKGLLQKEIANYLGITQGGYAFYERGERKPDPETLNKLARFFDVSVDYLLGKTNNPNGYEEKQNIVKMVLDEETEVYFYDAKNVSSEKLEKFKQIYNLVFKDNE